MVNVRSTLSAFTQSSSASPKCEYLSLISSTGSAVLSGQATCDNMRLGLGFFRRLSPELRGVVVDVDVR